MCVMQKNPLIVTYSYLVYGYLPKTDVSIRSAVGAVIYGITPACKDYPMRQMVYFIAGISFCC